MPNRDIAQIIAPLRRALDALLEIQKSLGIARPTAELDPTRQHGPSLIEGVDQPPPSASQPQLQIELQGVVGSLDPLQAGHDRFCCHCLRAIPTEHLRNDPDTPFCIDCISAAARPRSHPTWY